MFSTEIQQLRGDLVGAIVSLEQVEGQPLVLGTGAVADLYEAITQEERLWELL